jgi:quercetin dioxygenase-like cupin family protein
MEIVTMTKEEMLARRVVHFADMKPSKQAYLDSRLPRHQKESFHVIGIGVTENHDDGEFISEAEDFNVNYTRAKPGMGAALHAHPTVEAFIPITGRWSVQFGSPDGVSELELGPLDVISVPKGVMRGFTNISDEEAILLVIFGAPGGDAGHVQWDDRVVQQAAELGDSVTGEGRLSSASTS